MTPEEFVAVLRRVVIDQTVEGVFASVADPPGRRPRRELTDLSAWQRGLPESERDQLRQFAALVARSAVFGVLALLDGVRAVDEMPENGRFELTFHKGGSEWVLNPERGTMLHDLLNSDVGAE